MSEFRHRFRPRYYEIDRQGVLFNMWYLAYLDDAVGRFFTARGAAWEQWASQGFDIQIVHVELDYAAGLTDDRDSEIAIRPGRIGTKSFTLDFVFLADLDAVEPTQAVVGRVVYAVIDPDGSGAIPIPDPLRGALQA
ncbi:acyl-CoA thioesterase [Tsukamurella sputi]|uniref:Acyl-CoA thioesterase n=1 Tax=Tsukamurella sputi TaxID=2591848 RepID=A0A5C5RPB8_9ACTN|nr:thioesterase family protein [Tsukamurella sputi]TWS24929.1 acyl-CoA thioesterase [Tsukamurella sputi]